MLQKELFQNMTNHEESNRFHIIVLQSNIQTKSNRNDIKDTITVDVIKLFNSSSPAR